MSNPEATDHPRSGRHGFPIVGAGSVSRADFTRFKHRFSKTLPLPPFLLSSTPTPSHPFVILAILTHIPGFTSPETHALIDESVFHACEGAVDDEVLLALLILSLQPFTSDRLSSWSPVRLISMAYDIGRSKGMESLVRSSIRHADMTRQPLWSKFLEKVLLVSRVSLYVRR